MRNCWVAFFVSSTLMVSSVGALAAPTPTGSSTRRTFLAIPLAALASSVALPSRDDGHSAFCSCDHCGVARWSYGPRPASAIEVRDVGDENRSAATAAMNIQAIETNARLEASGFKLDSRQEEASRLSEALSSFSYDNSSQNVKGGGKPGTEQKNKGMSRNAQQK